MKSHMILLLLITLCFNHIDPSIAKPREPRKNKNKKNRPRAMPSLFGGKNGMKMEGAVCPEYSCPYNQIATPNPEHVPT